jgi:hypothetical protein
MGDHDMSDLNFTNAKLLRIDKCLKVIPDLENARDKREIIKSEIAAILKHNSFNKDIAHS